MPNCTALCMALLGTQASDGSLCASITGSSFKKRRTPLRPWRPPELCALSSVKSTHHGCHGFACPRRAGSYAPVTLLVDEREGGVRLSYDTMSSAISAATDQMQRFASRPNSTQGSKPAHGGCRRIALRSASTRQLLLRLFRITCRGRAWTRHRIDRASSCACPSAHSATNAATCRIHSPADRPATPACPARKLISFCVERSVRSMRSNLPRSASPPVPRPSCRCNGGGRHALHQSHKACCARAMGCMLARKCQPLFLHRLSKMRT